MQAMDDDHARTGMTGEVREPWSQGSGPGGDGGLRASDAERDQVAAELGEHFQAGRLDQSEFDERLTEALRARTRGELDVLLRDLPAATRRGGLPHDGTPAVASQPGAARLAPLLIPLLLVAVVTTGGLLGDWHHGPGYGRWPLLWVAIAVLIWRRHARHANGRGR